MLKNIKKHMPITNQNIHIAKELVVSKHYLKSSNKKSQTSKTTVPNARITN
jgi:hypothetical protein